MEILITNDDGYLAKGINELAREVEKLGHVTIVAPDGPRSGQSNAVTMGKPTRLRLLSETLTRTTYISDGTPSDCVKLGLEVVFKDRKPDVVLAGINHGSNAAVNVIYSGTMGAVFVANELQVPAIGFSLCTHEQDPDFSFFIPYICPLIDLLLKENHSVCWNVNAPVGPIKGYRFGRQCKGYWTEDVVETRDPFGEPIYWLAGYFKNTEPDATDTDLYALDNGYISICPSSIDMTDHQYMQKLNGTI